MTILVGAMCESTMMLPPAMPASISGDDAWPRAGGSSLGQSARIHRRHDDADEIALIEVIPARGEFHFDASPLGAVRAQHR